MEIIDFLKPAEGDNKVVSDLKESLQKSLDDKDLVAIAYMKLMSIITLILKKKEPDEKFLDVAGDALETAINLFRDSVNYGTLAGLDKIPAESQNVALKFGLSILVQQLKKTEQRLSLLASAAFGSKSVEEPR